MLVTTIATVLALYAGQTPPAVGSARALEVQYRVPRHPPPCGNGWDLSARDGFCYPNGYLPPQDQEARQPGRYLFNSKTGQRTITAGIKN